MPDRALIDRLDGTVDALLARGDATNALKDPELAPLARVASALRHYPSPEFKARLRAHLARRATMSTVLASTSPREGYATITPYIRVREAGLADFLARVFGAVETFAARGPAGGMHREVRVGDSMLMIGEGGPGGVMPIRPSELHVYVQDVDAAFQRALAAGATSLGEPANRPYGERAGFVRDAFGNHWFIATHLGASFVPEGLRTVTPLIHVAGTADYIDFLTRAFGAVEERRHEEGSAVRYARMRIGDAAIELNEAGGGADATPSGFMMYVDDPDGLYERAVAAGAQSLSAPTEQSYGRVAAVQDAMGNQWFITRPRASTP